MENIRYIIIIWGGAALLLAIGIYKSRRKEPVRIWTGIEVEAGNISNVPAYNRAVGRMWILSSVPLWIFGIAEFWYPVFAIGIAIAFFSLFCIVGIPLLIWYAHKIEEKYKAH